MKQPKVEAGSGYYYEIDDGRLLLSVGQKVQQTLKESFQGDADECDPSDNALLDALENWTSNSELDWVQPKWCRDITDAPMLGILGPPEPGIEDRGRLAGRWETSDGVLVDWYEPVIARWAFLDYWFRSPLQDLIDNGEVMFVGGEI